MSAAAGWAIPERGQLNPDARRSTVSAGMAVRRRVLQEKTHKSGSRNENSSKLVI